MDLFLPRCICGEKDSRSNAVDSHTSFWSSVREHSYVDVYGFPDGRLEVRSKGLVLPYSVFSKDQRVSHTAIVENKRLGHTLALIKAQQNSHFEAKVKTNSEKGQ